MWRAAGLLLCGACAASTPGPVGNVESGVEPPEASDPLLSEVAERFPAGADHCVVARPELLSDEQRRLYGQVSQADPVAWAVPLRLRAFGSVARKVGDTGGQYVALLRLAAHGADPREVLATASRWDLRWGVDAESCTPDACPTAARQIEPDLVRLERGPWRTGDGMMDAHCQQLARQHPDALEVSAHYGGPRREVFDLEMMAPASLLPQRTTTVARLRRGGVVLNRVDVMLTEEGAKRVVEGSGSFDPSLLGVEPVSHDIRRRREGLTVFTTVDVLFEDLRMREADDERHAAAAAYAEALKELVAPDQVDVGDLAMLHSQVGLHLEVVRNSSHGNPTDAIEQLKRLVNRGLVAHPGDERLLRALSDLSAPATPRSEP